MNPVFVVPLFSPVKGTRSSLSLCSMACFSRKSIRAKRSKGPVALFLVWSRWRNPAGRIAFWKVKKIIMLKMISAIRNLPFTHTHTHTHTHMIGSSLQNHVLNKKICRRSVTMSKLLFLWKQNAFWALPSTAAIMLIYNTALWNTWSIRAFSCHIFSNICCHPWLWFISDHWYKYHYFFMSLTSHPGLIHTNATDAILCLDCSENGFRGPFILR